MYRNRRVLDEARHHSCQSCNADDNTIVAAHSNSSTHGKGMSIKAHDCFVAYLCHSCHSYVDTGRGSREQRTAVWEAAHQKTVPLFQHLLNKEGRALLGIE